MTAAKAAVQDGRAHSPLTNGIAHAQRRAVVYTLVSLSNREQIALYSDLFTELEGSPRRPFRARLYGELD